MKKLLPLIIIFSLSILSFQSYTETDAPKDVLVVFKKQLDLNKMPKALSKEEKATWVYEESKALAEAEQKRLTDVLDIWTDLKYQTFHVINAVKVKDADINFLNYIAGFEEIAYVQEDSPVRVSSFEVVRENNIPTRALEWGLEKMNVDDVWALGNQGSGTVIAGQDTGYDWTHPALQASYRGWDGSAVTHDYNWHDAIHELNPMNDTTVMNPCGLNTLEPCDDNSHGTHTMGTMTGEAPDEQIGVAPQAKWIACRNMERGYGTPSTYIECYEWFLAPTDLDGNNPDVSKAPDVINNSWGCPEIEGCNPSNFATMETVINNLKASGIVIVVSAGNSGNSCGSVNTPSAIFENSFSVGASNIIDSLAGFSSRGPVMVDGSMRMKPNVSAPGVSVRSSTPGGNYASFSGTSMAGPHVAGVVALMISANPSLRGDVEAIETILENTAVPLQEQDDDCGGTLANQVPNNIYGYGRIDALAAVNAATNYVSNENIEEIILALYPNPTKDKFQIELSSIEGQIDIRIWSVDGKLQQQETRRIGAGDSDIEVNLEDLSKGVYFLEITKEEKTWQGKVIKI